MAIQLRILDWLVEVDRDATIEAHKALSSGAEKCGCPDCCYFLRVREHIFPKDFLNILNNLGIDYRKDAEVYAVDFSEKKIFFNGWYHACGRILKGELIETPALGQIQKIEYRPLPDSCGILIREAQDLASQTFPKPILQLEFSLEVDNDIGECKL